MAAFIEQRESFFFLSVCHWLAGWLSGCLSVRWTVRVMPNIDDITISALHSLIPKTQILSTILLPITLPVIQVSLASSKLACYTDPVATFRIRCCAVWWQDVKLMFILALFGYRSISIARLYRILQNQTKMNINSKMWKLTNDWVWSLKLQSTFMFKNRQGRH